jgi:hypothetical protein
MTMLVALAHVIARWGHVQENKTSPSRAAPIAGTVRDG